MGVEFNPFVLFDQRDRFVLLNREIALYLQGLSFNVNPFELFDQRDGKDWVLTLTLLNCLIREMARTGC